MFARFWCRFTDRLHDAICPCRVEITAEKRQLRGTEFKGTRPFLEMMDELKAWTERMNKRNKS